MCACTQIMPVYRVVQDLCNFVVCEFMHVFFNLTKHQQEIKITISAVHNCKL